MRILLRADSGFARQDLMAWCEANDIDFLFGLAKNERLTTEIKAELDLAAASSRRTGTPARRFKTFMWLTRSSWSRRRRVVAKAEWTQGEANPRFVVTRWRARRAAETHSFPRLPFASSVQTIYLRMSRLTFGTLKQWRGGCRLIVWRPGTCGSR